MRQRAVIYLLFRLKLCAISIYCCIVDKPSKFSQKIQSLFISHPFCKCMKNSLVSFIFFSVKKLTSGSLLKSDGNPFLIIVQTVNHHLSETCPRPCRPVLRHPFFSAVLFPHSSSSSPPQSSTFISSESYAPIGYSRIQPSIFNVWPHSGHS